MTGPAGPLTRSEAAALLGVDAAASPADVQRAFLRAARRVHPDVLTDADDVERHEAALAFDRLMRARDVLLVPAASALPVSFAGRPQQRGLGGSLVVLALLSFLLVLLVTVEQGARIGPFQDSPSSTSPALAP